MNNCIGLGSWGPVRLQQSAVSELVSRVLYHFQASETLQWRATGHALWLSKPKNVSFFGSNGEPLPTGHAHWLSKPKMYHFLPKNVSFLAPTESPLPTGHAHISSQQYSDLAIVAVSLTATIAWSESLKVLVGYSNCPIMQKTWNFHRPLPFRKMKQWNRRTGGQHDMNLSKHLWVLLATIRCALNILAGTFGYRRAYVHIKMYCWVLVVLAILGFCQMCPLAAMSQ